MGREGEGIERRTDKQRRQTGKQIDKYTDVTDTNIDIH